MVRLRRMRVPVEDSPAFKHLYQRAVQFCRSGNYCLAADYIIRGLNMHSKHVPTLLLGQYVGPLIHQEELGVQCSLAISALAARRNWSSSTTEDLLESIPELHGVFEEDPTPVGDGELEELLVKERTTLGEAQHALNGVALGERSVVVLENEQFGRGLFADKALLAGKVLLTERAVMCQRMRGDVCAQCLQPTQPSKAVSCSRCSESYCSEGCRDAALVQYHRCVCQNEDMQSWSAQFVTQILTEATDKKSARDARAALYMLAVGKVCAMATVQQEHPLMLPSLRQQKGRAQYDPVATLANAAISITLANSLRQPQLFLEDVLSVFGVLQQNAVLDVGGLALFEVISLLNHSCSPNCQLQGTPSAKQLVARRDIRAGEQLLVDYNEGLTSSLPYEERKKLFAERHFQCFCEKCVLKQ